MPTVSELMSQNISNAITNSQTWGGVIYNVKSYGAIGDGVTDDTTSIQSAIDAAHDDGGGEVRFICGETYLVGTALTYYDDVYFTGHGVTFTGAFGTNIATLNDETNVTDIKYYSAAGVYLQGPTSDSPMVMELGGLYCRGRSSNVQPLAKLKIVEDLIGTFPTALPDGSETADTWYAVFIVRKSDGTASLQFMPFIRVKSDTSNVITFGTHLDASVTQDYSFTTNELANCEFIVLTSGTTNNTHVGKLRTVSANSATTITYSGDSIGMTQGAYLMISPPGFTQYGYLGCFKNDSSSNVLNFYKVGNVYHSLGSTILSNATDTTMTSLDNGKWLAPTAQSVYYNGTARTINSPTAGASFGFQVGADDSHYSFRPIYAAQNIVAQQTYSSQGWVNMLYPPYTYYAGVGGANFSNLSLQIYGWME